MVNLLVELSVCFLVSHHNLVLLGLYQTKLLNIAWRNANKRGIGHRVVNRVMAWCLNFVQQYATLKKNTKYLGFFVVVYILPK